MGEHNLPVSLQNGPLPAFKGTACRCMSSHMGVCSALHCLAMLMAAACASLRSPVVFAGAALS